MGLIVIDPGLSTTVQDAGRPGYRQWGVPPAGAFDRGSALLANALVANRGILASLEFTLRGGVYQATSPLALALAGAPMPAVILRNDGSRACLVPAQSFTLLAGESLEVGQTREGARTYLAVRGGWKLPRALGSNSSESRLHSGDILEATPSQIAARLPVDLTWRLDPDRPIRIIGGPDTHFLSAIDHDFWPQRSFRVNPRSNRMGLRLEGEPINGPVIADRLSTPASPGAVQLAGRQLIVLGIACGTMGGYPLIAHVITADVDRLGQLRPGDIVRFERVTLTEARQLSHAADVKLTARLSQIIAAAEDEIRPK